MKVSKCGSEKAIPKELTWDEMILSEGVYRAADATYSSRFIVVRGDSPPCVIRYHLGELSNAHPSWRNQKFVLTNETVCFELKSAS